MNEMMKYLPPSPFSRHVSLTLFHMVETIESIEKLFVRQLHVFLLLEQMAANWTNADFGHQQTHQLGRDGRKRRNHGHTVHWWPVLPNETMETKKPWGSAPNGKNKQVKERIKKEKKKKKESISSWQRELVRESKPRRRMWPFGGWGEVQDFCPQCSFEREQRVKEKRKRKGAKVGAIGACAATHHAMQRDGKVSLLSKSNFTCGIFDVYWMQSERIKWIQSASSSRHSPADTRPSLIDWHHIIRFENLVTLSINCRIRGCRCTRFLQRK